MISTCKAHDKINHQLASICIHSLVRLAEFESQTVKLLRFIYVSTFFEISIHLLVVASILFLTFFLLVFHFFRSTSSLSPGNLCRSCEKQWKTLHRINEWFFDCLSLVMCLAFICSLSLNFVEALTYVEYYLATALRIYFCRKPVMKCNQIRLVLSPSVFFIIYARIRWQTAFAVSPSALFPFQFFFITYHRCELADVSPKKIASFFSLRMQKH